MNLMTELIIVLNRIIRENEDDDKNGDELEGKGDDPEGKNENSKIKDTIKSAGNKNSKKKKSN